MEISEQLPKPLNGILNYVLKGVMDWQAKNTEQHIHKAVHERLDKARDTIVLKLLGFNASSFEGTWELDHCNGRNGESAAGQYLRKVQSEAIQKWLEQIEIPEVKLPATVLKRLRKNMVAEYESKLRQNMYALALKYAEADAKSMFDEITKADQLHNIQKLMDLLGSNPAAPAAPTPTALPSATTSWPKKN